MDENWIYQGFQSTSLGFLKAGTINLLSRPVKAHNSLRNPNPEELQEAYKEKALEATIFGTIVYNGFDSEGKASGRLALRSRREASLFCKGVR